LILIALLLSLSSARAEEAKTPFYWGVANAAIQTEGDPGESDWSAWAKLPGKIDDGSTPAQAFGFYRNYEREFDTAQALHANAFRLSIAWERIEPKRGEFDEAALAHYESMMLALRKRGIEPMVTLHHFVNPAWLKDGLLNPEFPERFAIFSEKVVARLSAGPAKVRWWSTLNEPVVLALAGYVDGQFPPGEKGNLDHAEEAMAQLVRAHWRAVEKLRKLPGGESLRIGIAAHWRPFEPKNRWSPLDWIASWFSARFFDRAFVDAIRTGAIRFWMPGAKWIHEDLSVAGIHGIDYFGVNYYGRSLVHVTLSAPYVSASEGPGRKNDLGWEIYPEGLRTTLREVAEYHLPILITENGVADESDLVRANFLKEHIAEIDRARAEGIPIIGYLHWTLTDNFEWARGMKAKFGFCTAGPGRDDQRCRPSFNVYRHIIRAHRE
jgi:beta-glucosidase